MGTFPYALQLYTVRDHLEKDVPGTLRRVKDAGYDFVEMAGIGLHGPREYNAMLNDAGLKAVSSHFPYEDIVKNTAATIETTQALGLQYAVVPWLGGELCPDRDAWFACARTMDEAGAKFRAADITLCYHNHAHEFERLGEQYIFDLIYESAAAHHLALELDSYWVQYGGADPVEKLNQYKGRCPLLHVKDMSADASRTFTEVGRGIMDWGVILPAAAKAGVQWFIVEQDTCPGDSIESARISAEYMRSL